MSMKAIHYGILIDVTAHNSNFSDMFSRLLIPFILAFTILMVSKSHAEVLILFQRVDLNKCLTAIKSGLTASVSEPGPDIVAM